jgi:nucleotide-binding universal stress UspA family protein
MYEDILLPYDGNDGAAAVLQHASELGQWADATIHILFVADTTRDSVTVIRGQTVDALVQKGEEIVAEAEQTLQTLGVDYRTEVVQGNPAPTIVEYADQYDYDLVVLPTHGREGISRYLIGSVTEKVVRLSSVPVLTARMLPDEQLTFPYENILIPTDGSPVATRAINHGLSLASTLNATVHAVSVVDGTSLGLDVRSTVASSPGEEAAIDALDDLTSEAEAYEPTEIVRHIEHGDPIEEILACIESNGIDALVMGTTGRRGTERILLGSVAEKTVRSAPIPVITVGQSG